MYFDTQHGTVNIVRRGARLYNCGQVMSMLVAEQKKLVFNTDCGEYCIYHFPDFKYSAFLLLPLFALIILDRLS